MQKHLLYIPLIALSSALALTACSDEVTDTLTPDLPIGEKTPIELSVGGVDTPNAATRAVITDGKDKTLKAFDENTSLYMLMKSDNVSDGSKPALVTRTIMFALPQTDEDKYYSDVNYSASNEYDKFARYWDDSYARSSALSILAVCTPGMGANVDKKTWNISGSDVGYANRGWETISGASGDVPYTSIIWPIGNTNEYNSLKLLTDQSVLANGASFIKNQDLCFSNNIGDWSEKGGADRRLKFDPTTKKFPRSSDKWDDNTFKTRMVFYHALSKLTFRFKMGDGFTAADFKFNENTNVKLSNFYNQGTFNIEQGEFVSTGTGVPTTGTIDRIYQHSSLTSEETSAGYKYILDALVIPGTDMSASEEAVTFYIYNNEYKLTRAQLYAAFSAEQKSGYFDSGKLKAGVHYIFTFTVGKTLINNITASIVDWEEVEADNLDPSNARIKLQLEERTGDKTETLTSGDAFSLYRAFDDIPETDEIDDDYAAFNWATQYSNDGVGLSWDSENSRWTTNWYWENNKNFYHFRALCEQTSNSKQKVSNSLANDATGDYLALNHCEKTSTAAYKDILWGAPMRDIGDNSDDDRKKLQWFYGPEINGFDAKDNGDIPSSLPVLANGAKHQIYQAIGPTKDAIKLILFHMMSDVTFKIQTTTGADKVNLGTGTGTDVTTIKLEQIHTTGNLYMGNGLVKGSDAVCDYPFTTTPAPDGGVITWPHYGAIPQSLTDVVLVITTPDNNQYKVAMKDVLATSVNTNNIANPYSTVGGSGDDKNKYKINRWYPGFKYTYTFTLKKTGITDLQVTILDWETVEADNQEVVIQ